MKISKLLSYTFFISLLIYFRGRLNESMLILLVAEIYLLVFTFIKFPGESGPLKNRKISLSFEEDMVGPSDFSGFQSGIHSHDEFDTGKLLFLLNLEAPLTADKLKKRYREISLLYHPDRLAQMSEKQREVAEAEFKRLTNAKELLEKTL